MSTTIQPICSFYIWIPIILYVLSLVNLGIRYVSIDAFYRKNIAGEANDHVSSTLIRYIILCGDNMFLRIGGTDDLGHKSRYSGRKAMCRTQSVSVSMMP